MIKLYELTGKYKWVWGTMILSLLWVALPYIAALIQIAWSYLPGSVATVVQAYRCGAIAAGLCVMLLFPADWLYEGFRREIYPSYIGAMQERNDKAKKPSSPPKKP